MHTWKRLCCVNDHHKVLVNCTSPNESYKINLNIWDTNKVQIRMSPNTRQTKVKIHRPTCIQTETSVSKWVKFKCNSSRAADISVFFFNCSSAQEQTENFKLKMIRSPSLWSRSNIRRSHWNQRLLVCSVATQTFGHVTQVWILMCVQCNRAGPWFVAAADGPGVQPPDWWRAGTGSPATLQHPVQDGAEVAVDRFSTLTPPPFSQERGCQVTSFTWWDQCSSCCRVIVQLVIVTCLSTCSSDQELCWTSGVTI